MELVEESGRFDFVFIATPLLHLSDPVRILTAIRDVHTGELIRPSAGSRPL